MSVTRRCPALFISAPASGQGKTTITAALAWRERQRGKRVRVFKTGADFIDPMILERASGNAVYQLDLWMGGEAHCRQLLYDAAGDADLILVEGVMGLFDGNPSSADLATLFGIPVMAVIDASGMAQTFDAVAYGLTHYRSDVPSAGTFANRVGSERHATILMADSAGLIGCMPRDADIVLPERHLGLIQAAEIADIDARLARAGASLQGIDERRLVAIEFAPAMPSTTSKTPATFLQGMNIGVARDDAFSFVYRANLDTLRLLGAQLHFFSPLTDTVLPRIDALYLPGGYPELHLSTLQNNRAMREAIARHHSSGKPIFAECGGMLYLLESLTDADGQRGDMLGLLPGRAVMQKRLSALALQRVVLPEGELRGHTFHYSRVETDIAPIARGACPNGGKTAEAVYRVGTLTASYIHSYFPSNPETAARLFLQ